MFLSAYTKHLHTSCKLPHITKNFLNRIQYPKSTHLLTLRIFKYSVAMQISPKNSHHLHSQFRTPEKLIFLKFLSQLIFQANASVSQEAPSFIFRGRGDAKNNNPSDRSSNLSRIRNLSKECISTEMKRTFRFFQKNLKCLKNTYFKYLKDTYLKYSKNTYSKI